MKAIWATERLARLEAIAELAGSGRRSPGSPFPELTSCPLLISFHLRRSTLLELLRRRKHATQTSPS